VSIVRRVTPALLVVIGLLLIRTAAAGPARGPGPATAATTPTHPIPDTREKLIRRFHLTWQDAPKLEAAVRQGRATRPDLQPAALAEHTKLHDVAAKIAAEASTPPGVYHSVTRSSGVPAIGHRLLQR